MDTHHIRLPVGVRDYLPQATERRRHIAATLLREIERWGYARIIPPAIEYSDVLARGLGEQARPSLLRFVEPATGQIVALRPDFTPQVARIAATRYADVGGPLRLCYEGSVLRLSPAAHGHKEIIQVGAEFIQAPSPEGDAEIIALAAAALHATKLRDVTIDVGHVAIADRALSSIDDVDLRQQILSAIEKKDRNGVERLAKTLPAARRKIVTALPTLYGDPEAVLKSARALPLDKQEKLMLDALENTIAHATQELARGKVTIDLGETRGLGYYTGLHFTGFVPGVGRAVLRGGRYDHLVGCYGPGAPAVGFAVDVEALAQADPDAAKNPTHQRVLVVPAAPTGDEERAEKIGRALRRAGKNTAVHLQLGGRRSEKIVLRYARRAGFSKALILGPRNADIHDLVSGSIQKVTQKIMSAAKNGNGRELAKRLDSQ